MNEPTGNNHAHQATAVGASLSDRVRALRLPQTVSAGQSPGRPWLPWALCAVLAISTLASGWLALKRPAAGPAPAAAPATGAGATPANVSGSGPVAATGDVAHESRGYVIPAHQIQVSPRVGGLIVKLQFEEGQRVKKGQVLAQIETTDYKAERDRMRATLDQAWQRYMELYSGYRPAEVAAARAELDEAEAMREQYHLEYKRNLNLTGQAVSTREREQAFSAYKAAERKTTRLRHAYDLMVEGPRKERIEAAWADVMQAEAELAKAEWRLDNCTVRAPVAGTILSKYAEEGNIVNQMALNLKGSVCDMADLADLEVELKIQERDVAKVHKGQKCRVRCDAYPDRIYEGVVSRLMPIADRAQSAVPVRVKLKVPSDEEGVYLKPEMGAVVSFLKN
jgi:multidrug resistance efflux pump